MAALPAPSVADAARVLTRAELYHMGDTLVNFVTGLGTFRDPSQSGSYAFNALNRNDLENAYRSDWIARQVIDSIPEDATREWRDWQAADDQIEAIEALEKAHRIQLKTREALTRARLYGGAALVLGVEQGQSYEPLDVERVGEGDLKFVAVMNRYELNAGPRIYDVSSPWYTRPQYYTVVTPTWGFDPGNRPPLGSNVVRFAAPVPSLSTVPISGPVYVHPSRVIEFWGNQLPDWRLAPMGGGWGDSVLQLLDDTLRQWGMMAGGSAAMVNDGKMDVIKVPGLSERLGDTEYSNRLLTRFMTANQGKSIINSLLLDEEETWDRVKTNFGGLPQLLREFMVVVSGAAQIPVSKLFGQAAGRGLGASSGGGESDLRNYYDKVSIKQRTEYTPAMEPLDEVIIRSALGARPPEIHYDWAPLWQQDDTTKATVALQRAQATQVYVNSGLFNEDMLRDITVNQLTEDGTYPGIEAAVDEHGAEPDIPESRVWSPGYDPRTGLPLTGAAAQSQAPVGGRSAALAVPPTSAGQRALPTRDAAPRTLYVRRDVTNAAEIIAHFKKQGVETTIPADQMHVTVTFSRAPVDWMRMGADWAGANDSGDLRVRPGGARLVNRFGDAVVLLFSSQELQWRHQSMIDQGASWDHAEYQPHVTITWNSDGLDWQSLEPWCGAIELGPEIFEQVRDDWRATVQEDAAPRVGSVESVPTHQIRATKPRAKLGQDHVAHFRRIIRSGGHVPPLDVVHDETAGVYRVVNGNHRLAALRSERVRTADVRIVS